eukprot:scaffold38330_cov31-Tisochrysis_lutea.AAC.7
MQVSWRWVILTTMIAIGCASLLKPPKKARSRSCTSQFAFISLVKDASWEGVGSSPSISRKATSASGAEGGDFQWDVALVIVQCTAHCTTSTCTRDGSVSPGKLQFMARSSMG